MGLNKHSDWFDPFDPLSTLSANQQRPSERCYPSVEITASYFVNLFREFQ